MIRGWLETLGINEICQLDVLVFLHHHRTALLSAEQMAGFMCHGSAAVVAALDHLESLRIVERSRLSQGARIYQVIPLPDGPRGRAFQELMALMESRAGRLAITEKLRETNRRTAVVVLSVPAANQRAPLAGKGARQWPKAI